MQLLKERILKDGVVKPGNILKVDSFLNHQMDIDLINEIGKEFKARFSDCPITKILTIEASGIGKKFLSPEDHVLLIDDFLANGCALLGLIDIVKKSGATLEGAGIVIEKGFQHGGQQIRDMGVRLESLAIIDSMTDDSLTFRD